MDEKSVLLARLEEILQEDKVEIRQCIGGDFLSNYELYMKEEMAFWEMMKRTICSFYKQL